MRIAWVSHSVGMLGAERVMMEGVGQLAIMGIDCHIALPADHSVGEPWHDLNLSQSRLPIPWWMAGRAVLTWRRRLGMTRDILRAVPPMLAWLDRIAPQAVITNSLVTPVVAIATAIRGIPHLWYVHEFGDRDHGLEFAFGRSPSLQAVNRSSRRIIVNSHAVAAHFATHFPAHKTDLLYCAVAAPDFEPRHHDIGIRPKLVMVAGVSPQKRQEDAIHAVAILRNSGRSAELRIVGPGHGDYLDRLHRLVAELNVADLVTFAGSSDNPFADYRAANLALTCARDEAFGRVTVEAMKMGVPVIGARSGGTTEIICDGVNGLLYEPCNPEDLAAQIAQALSNPAMLAQMGLNARKLARETFNLPTYGRQLVSILEKSIEPMGMTLRGASA